MFPRILLGIQPLNSSFPITQPKSKSKSVVEPILEAGLSTPHTAYSTTPTGLEADKSGRTIENSLGSVFVSFCVCVVGDGRGILETREAIQCSLQEPRNETINAGLW